MGCSGHANERLVPPRHEVRPSAQRAPPVGSRGTPWPGAQGWTIHGSSGSVGDGAGDTNGLGLCGDPCP